MPTLEALLSRGYLPKELPPPFTAAQFGRVLAGTAIPAGFGSNFTDSSLCLHTLARPGMLRRPLAIPHPAPHFRMSRLLVSAWPDIESHMDKSGISLSVPIDDPTGSRALAPSGSTDIADERATRRATSRYMLVADISQYYSSIYTHSLAWALHTKAVAKIRPPDMSLIGNQLDLVVRRAQDRQTIGIPVGPDSSAVLAEIILSSCDQELQRRTNRLVGFRWYDDYELYFDTRTAADEALAALETALAEYQLVLNPYKTRVFELPQELEEGWLTELRRIDLRDSRSGERTDLIHLFDRAFALARAYSGRHVLAYALGRLERQVAEDRRLVREENWPILQRLIVQAAVNEPGALAKAVPLLRWAQTEFGYALDRSLISRGLDLISTDGASRGVASEVAAALWGAIGLRARLHRRAATAISGVGDDVVALLALHARERGVIARGISTALWQRWMNSDSLAGEHWLASYEARAKGWLQTTGGGDHRTGVREFATLAAANVSFYDPGAPIPGPVAGPTIRLAPFPPGMAVYA